MKAASAVLVFLTAILLAVYAVRDDRPHPKPVPGQWPEPLQSACSRETWQVDDRRITALATYDIQATVLSTERYYFDPGAKLSPVDFAVGWGPLSDLSVAGQLSLSQGGRWFRYRIPAARFPLSANEINSHSANMHLIPSDDTIRGRILSARPGDVVRLAGRLVEVTGDRGYKWRSSLSRTDTGGGACELLWVERIDWVQ